MSWSTPKEDWTAADVPLSSDFNRIESNISFIGANPVTNKLQLNGIGNDVVIGTNPTIEGRADAQLELHNDGTGHAMFSTVMQQNPGVTNLENAWSGAGYNSAGTLTQMGSFYMRWDDNDATTGYSVIGMHPNYDGGATGPGAFEVFGNHGILIFGGSSATPPPDNQVMIVRTPSRPNMTGNSGGDFILDSNWGGSAQSVYINAFNAGNTILNSAGGDTKIGTATGYGGKCEVVHTSGVTQRLDKTSGAYLLFSRAGVAGFSLSDDALGALTFSTLGTTPVFKLTPSSQIECDGNILPWASPSSGSQALTVLNETYDLPRGIYQIQLSATVTVTQLDLEQYINGAWVIVSSAASAGGTVVTDVLGAQFSTGASTGAGAMRVKLSSLGGGGSATVYWNKF